MLASACSGALLIGEAGLLSNGEATRRLDQAEFMEWPAPPSGVVGSPANQEEEGMDISVLGIDLGKNVCSVWLGLDVRPARL